MKQVEAKKVRELLELVRAGQPVPVKLLERCAAAIERELEINRGRGRRAADFFSVRSALEGAGEVVDGKAVARVAQQLRATEAELEAGREWDAMTRKREAAADLRDLLADVGALDDAEATS